MLSAVCRAILLERVTVRPPSTVYAVPTSQQNLIRLLHPQSSTAAIAQTTVVFGVTYSQYSATVHVFDGTLMICLWYGGGRVGWGGVGWGGLKANNVQVDFYTRVMLR